MRVLLVSRCPPYPLHLGDRLIVWHLARELHKLGHQLELLAFAQFDSDWDEIDLYHDWFAEVTLLPEPKRTPLHYIQRIAWPPARFPEQAAAAWSPAMWQVLAQRLHDQHYDVVHLFGSVQVYEFAHLLRDQPCLITPYESFALYLERRIAERGALVDRLRRWVAQQIERWMFTPYQRVVVVAEPDQAALKQLNPTLPTTVISNGVDLKTFVPTSAARAPATLLFIGNYAYEPNLDAALFLAQDILPQVRQQIPEARLQLVGNGPPPELLALRSEGIEVTGRVPDVQPYLDTCTVFVCPLRWGAGIKNKVLEALAMAAPLVATPLSVDGIAAQHETHALIADSQHFASEIIRLLRDASLRETLGHNGRQLIVGQYSWAAVAQQYLALYQAVQAEKAT